jgi:hypothetical protein
MRGYAKKRGTSWRLGAVALVVCLASSGLSGAHSTNANGFSDTFETPGMLPSGPNDPWEVKSGIWSITDQSSVDLTASNSTNHVLVQSSKSLAPNDPIAFVRDKLFRSFTAQVTAAFMDPTSLFADLTPGSSVGLAFRSPLACPPGSPGGDCDPEDAIADQNNLYVFSAVVTGVSPGFPTGRAFALFKRVARGYYLLDTKTAGTWADLTQPHQYKVTMTGGHIQAFVDGRLVIDHTDIPSPDSPTTSDPFPGLPFDSGAVGVRTSGSRAWFDDFQVVGNDAYEGRALAVDAYTQYGERSQVRHGESVQLTNVLGREGLNAADTGFRYHDHDFNETIVTPLSGPGGDPALGATIGTSGKDGTTSSTARLSGVHLSFSDPNNTVTVQIQADSIESNASATCRSTSSALNIVNGFISIVVKNAPQVPDQTIGPFPLQTNYRPNTVVVSQKPFVTVIAHEERASTLPRRVDSTALKITFPEGSIPTIPGQAAPVTVNPPLEVSLGHVVAGRYCS